MEQNKPWWYPALNTLRISKKRNPGTNGSDLSAYVIVQILSDPNGWSVQWFQAFKKALNDYPTIGAIYQQVHPFFVFDSVNATESQIVVRDDATVIVPTNLNPQNDIFGVKELAWWFTIDILAYVLYWRVPLAARQQYTLWLDEQGALIAERELPENEVAYLFLLAACGPDQEIEALAQAFPDFFTNRWHWVRDHMVIPYVK